MPQIKEAGRHEVTATKAEYGESANGTPFLQILFEDAQGDSITGWVYLSEKALAGAIETLRSAFGFNGEFESATHQIEGKPCSIVTEFETYDGKERLKVKWINGLRTPPKPLSGGTSFLSQLTAKAKRIPAKSTVGAAPTRGVPAKDEDFPA